MCVFESQSGGQQNREKPFGDAGAEGAFDRERGDERLGAAVWADVHVPVVQPEGWPVHHLRMGLRELERLRREVEAAMALLTGAIPESRDTVADIARNAGVSNREARRRKSVADVCRKVKGALEKLQSGDISSEHVSALAPIADMPGAASLLDDAASKSPEELTRDVEEFRLSSACGDDMAKRQRARRFLRFYPGPDGTIGVSGLFPPVEGTELKNRIAAIVDARWRASHPERAKVLGGHGGDSQDQRMADALLSMAGVASQTFEESPDSQNSSGSQTFQNPHSSQSSPNSDRSEGSEGSEGLEGSGCPEADLAAEETGTCNSKPDDRDSSPAGDTHAPTGLTSAPRWTDGKNPSVNYAANQSRPSMSAAQQDFPRGALSIRDGLRLVGLPDSSMRGKSLRVQISNAPPPLPPPAQTTVKTGKPAVVIVFDVDRWKARIAGGGPVPITESLLDQTRNDLYYCFKNTVGEVIKFARSRRDPTPVQRLVLTVRDEKCLYPGPETCDVHHTNEVVKDNGRTDTDVMGLFCEAHHRHIHLNDLVVQRNTDGSLLVTERRTGAVVASTKPKKRAA